MRSLFRTLSSVVALTAGVVVMAGASSSYQPGTVGYDVSWPQCTSSTSTTSGPIPTSTGIVRNSAPPAVATTSPPERRSRSGPRLVTSGAVVSNRTIPSNVGRSSRGFGIVGVNHGHSFDYNNCLGDQYHRTPNPSLYLIAGYDPSYTSSSYTTEDCKAKSSGVSSNADQRAAWAVGCSEAQKDFPYATGQGAVSIGGWWLDVETGKSWCGQHGVSCDLSLNQYAIQGLIDTLLANNAKPVGIYSLNWMWAAIVGANHVHGQSADWYATGTNNAAAAAAYCSPAYSFTGDSVKLAQFTNVFDFDYAC